MAVSELALLDFHTDTPMAKSPKRTGAIFTNLPNCTAISRAHHAFLQERSRAL